MRILKNSIRLLFGVDKHQEEKLPIEEDETEIIQPNILACLVDTTSTTNIKIKLEYKPTRNVIVGFVKTIENLKLLPVPILPALISIRAKMSEGNYRARTAWKPIDSKYFLLDFILRNIKFMEHLNGTLRVRLYGKNGGLENGSCYAECEIPNVWLLQGKTTFEGTSQRMRETFVL